jgi:GNAT superfamily N-acetyltransferase
MTNVSLEFDGYLISSDKNLLDINTVHQFLHACYWAEGIPRAVVEKSIQNSVCFGIYQGKTQLGFARVITDYATFAYIGDVFVLESHRGKGLSKELMRIIMNHPDLQNLRRWVLVTRDAHDLYRKFGFQTLERPERYMELLNPDIYR